MNQEKDQGSWSNPVDDPVPPYTEVTKEAATSGVNRKAEASQTGTLSTRILEARKARINKLVDDQIVPVFEEHIECGISAMVLVLTLLEPQVILQPTDTAQGFGDTSSKLINIGGSRNDNQFWQQPSVLGNLETAVRARLGIEDKAEVGIPEPEPISQPEPVAKRYFWQKPAAGPSFDSPMFHWGQSSWKTDQSMAEGSNLSVSIEQVPIRTSSEMGFFTTRDCKAIVIRISVWL